MTDRPAAPRTELHRDVVGVIPLGLDDELTVVVVRRRWIAEVLRAHAVGRVATIAPAAVEVRRAAAPESEPGPMTTSAARRLAELIVEAVELAEGFDSAEEV